MQAPWTPFQSGCQPPCCQGRRRFQRPLLRVEEGEAATVPMITVLDDSLSGAGILRGDRVAVERAARAQHGQIVVAALGARLVLARLFFFNGQFELRAQRLDGSAPAISKDTAWTIWGVVVSCMRNYEEVTPPRTPTPTPTPAPAPAPGGATARA